MMKLEHTDLGKNMNVRLFNGTDMIISVGPIVGVKTGGSRVGGPELCV